MIDSPCIHVLPADEAVNELKFLELCHIGTMIVDFLSLFMRAMHLDVGKSSTLVSQPRQVSSSPQILTSYACGSGI